jgi:hypothetical protein
VRSGPRDLRLLVRDALRDVGGDRADLLLRELPLERWHAASSVRYLCDDPLQVLRGRDRREVGTTVPALAGRAVTNGAVVGEQLLA